MSVKQVVMAAAGALGGGDKLYVEDVFSTYLYTGNGSTQTIINGIDLDGEGGLVWIKSRQSRDHVLFDTVRGTTALETNTTDAAASDRGLTAYTSSGFSLNDPVAGDTNASGVGFASWTFRKAPKFFDVVTYTGSSSTQNISHNLGSVPGMIIVKRLNLSEEWFVYHRSTGASQHLKLNDIDGAGSSFQPWNNTAPTDSVFTVLGGRNEVNNAGSTYVAYLFAHDAGGFGDDGEQNIISCGSYTATSTAGLKITLGWEPQWLLIKPAGGEQGWFLFDNMRGVPTNGTTQAVLQPNTPYAEVNNSTRNHVNFDSDGFTLGTFYNDINSASNGQHIYIAIRRGPMKTPESGTEVFSAVLADGVSDPLYNTTFPVDMALAKNYDNSSNWTNSARLIQGKELNVDYAGAEFTSAPMRFDYQDGWSSQGFSSIYNSYNFKRAPSFFDVVGYTGTGSARTVNHNLGVAPEFIIVKGRTTATNWYVYNATIGNSSNLLLNKDEGAATPSPTRTIWNNTDPTSSVFSVGGTGWNVNDSGQNYISYLFATLAGVSKVGSYTGTGALQTIDCGFSSGARFVLIKRTDGPAVAGNGDWYVWDTTRGIVAGNDPYLFLNRSDQQVTTTDYIDPEASGFEISSSAPAALNASGGTYIFLAIA